MNTSMCSNCRLALRRTLRASLKPHQRKAAQSTTKISTGREQQRSQATNTAAASPSSPSELASLLSKPSWSVRSLLPPSASTSTSKSISKPTSTPTLTPSITRETLHHLLRLSALPRPQTRREEAQMLATLSSQLHFVRAIQGVDTTGVAPLRAIRDETARGMSEQTIGLAELREALDAEYVVGHARRPRRRRSDTQQQRNPSPSVLEEDGAQTGTDTARVPNSTHKETSAPTDEESWDVFAGASETAGGRYFVVRSNRADGLPPKRTVA